MLSPLAKLALRAITKLKGRGLNPRSLSLPWTQCGGINGRATDFAIHTAELCPTLPKDPEGEVLGRKKKYAHAAGCSSPDLEAAFHSMIQQSATEMPESDAAIAMLCHRLKLDTDTMHCMYRILSKGSILSNANVSGHERLLVQESFRCRWSAVGCADLLALPNSGCQPGMPFLISFLTLPSLLS